jgi:hypothetical protein
MSKSDIIIEFSHNLEFWYSKHSKKSSVISYTNVLDLCECVLIFQKMTLGAETCRSLNEDRPTWCQLLLYYTISTKKMHFF